MQALIECILKITKKIRYKGLDFTKTKEYSFNDIPALEQAGWTKEEYEKQKQADEQSYEEMCQDILNQLV